MQRNVVLDFKKQMEQVLVKRNESAHFNKRVDEFVNRFCSEYFLVHFSFPP